MKGKNAVVILSGGLDSTTCMAVAKRAGFTVYALTFDYGQRHRIELSAAAQVAKAMGAAEHRVATLPFLREIGGSALTDEALAVPTSGVNSAEIPITYVPARNLIFLSIATAYAEVVRASSLYIGVNALDYSGYPDCRPEFIEAFAQAANRATKVGAEGTALTIETPLLHLSKAEIVRLGMDLEAPLSLTTSCYEGRELACGVCDSCRLRLAGFAEAGFTDPIAYQN